MLQNPVDGATGVYCVMATVVNERTNVRLSVPLVNALRGMVPGDATMAPLDTALADSYSKFQNFFEVVSNDATPRPAAERYLVLR